jgi:hypothetical protein
MKNINEVDAAIPERLRLRLQITNALRAIPVGEARCIHGWIVLRTSINTVVIGFQTVSWRKSHRELNRIPIRRAVDDIWRTTID